MKQIHSGDDVAAFLSSSAYKQIMTFLFQLNSAMYPRITNTGIGRIPAVQVWDLGSPAVVFSGPVRQLRLLLQSLEALIEDAPPDPGPRRFGNVSFRKWSQLVEERIPALLREHVSEDVITSFSGSTEELTAYLAGSFGSAQRLDYGTGHELSFLAFLGSLWMLSGFDMTAGPGVEERGIVLGVFEPYVYLASTWPTYHARLTSSADTCAWSAGSS